MIQVESNLNSFKSPITVNMIADIKVRILATVWVSKVQKVDFRKLMGDGNVSILFSEDPFASGVRGSGSNSERVHNVYKLVIIDFKTDGGRTKYIILSLQFFLGCLRSPEVPGLNPRRSLNRHISFH